jgi:hypothetical protein
MKLKTIVAVVAFAAAGMANASMTPFSANNGSSLIFEAWDTTSNVGMVQVLSTDFTGAMSMASLSTTLNSATFANLLGTDTTGANLSWHVYGAMQNDNTVIGNGLITTVSTQPNAVFISTDSANVGVLANQLGTHFSAELIPILGAATFANIGSTNNAYGGVVGTAYYGSFFGGASAIKGFGAMDLYAYTNNPADFATITTHLTGAAGGDQKFTLASNGLLTFNASTPSAVPLPAAAWLFGSGLLGLVGVGRRRKQG